MKKLRGKYLDLGSMKLNKSYKKEHIIMKNIFNEQKTIKNNIRLF